MNKQTTIKQPKSWTKVESANFVRFENIGDSIEGLLTEKNVGDKMNFYKLRTFDNEEKKFHGTNQLDDLLSSFIPPCYVRITLTGSQDTANGTMKIFEVEKGEN